MLPVQEISVVPRIVRRVLDGRVRRLGAYGPSRTASHTRANAARMPPCVVVSSPPDDLRCYIYEGGKDSLDVYYSSLSINYRRDTSIKSGTISKLTRNGGRGGGSRL